MPHAGLSVRGCLLRKVIDKLIKLEFLLFKSGRCRPRFAQEGDAVHQRADGMVRAFPDVALRPGLEVGLLVQPSFKPVTILMVENIRRDILPLFQEVVVVSGAGKDP